MENYEKRGYLLENFRLFHLRTAQAPGVDFHYHEFCKLLLLVSGSGSYVVDGQRYRLQSGDIVLIPSRSIHRPELSPDTPYERVILYIDPEFLQRESAADCDLLACFHQGHILRLREPWRKKLFDLAAELERELARDGFGRSLGAKAALLRLLVRLGREQHREGRQEIPPIATEDGRIAAVMVYIDEHLEEELDIALLAERFFISKYHLMRQFRSQTGFTIHNYIIHRRLLHARELMSGGMAATHACYRSGFRSYCAFTRSYSKYLGTTPTGRAGRSQPAAEDYE